MTAPTSSAVVRNATRSNGEHRAFVGLTMASAAISIDLVLPAFARIRHDFGLPDGSAATAGLITWFFLGLACGPVPFGLLADRVGRRVVLRSSCVLFLIGALAAAIAPSLALINLARFVWGIGASGLRVTATAMIRDRHRGAQMAKELSFAMTIFILVPVFAPALGAGIVKLVPWRGVFVVCALFAAGIALWSLRMPETLAVAERQPLNVRQVGIAARVIATNRVALCYTIALMAMFGVFSSYLASSERIVGDVFHHRPLFPLVFGGTAIVMGIASVVTGRSVERVGLERMINGVLVTYALASVALVVFARSSSGVPSFVPYIVVLTIVIAAQQVLSSTMSAAAMIPTGHVAGTAAALFAMSSVAAGAVVGTIIDQRYDGTVTPFSTAQVSAAAIVVVLALVARRVKREPRPTDAGGPADRSRLPVQ